MKPLLRCLFAAASVFIALAMGACATPHTPAPGAAATDGDDLIVVAVADTPEVRPAAGAAPRARYGRGAGYGGSDRALALAAALVAEHGLAEVSAWTIPTLAWRCMLLRVPPGGERDSVLARLAGDARVRLVQPLNSFQTLSTAPGYDDPYLPMQAGFAAIDAAGAQRVSRGQGVTVAVVDTGIDASHPDLTGRRVSLRDFVGRPVPAGGERHGTEVAGIIAAAANNGLGIVGVAPEVKLLSLRSCWAGAAGQPSRCNTFTLAQGLAAAIAAQVDVINLSLGGPRDPLLEALALQAMARGIVVVGALPPGGQRQGFPSAVPGVLAVASSEDGPAPAGMLAAPGRRILTLAPGGGYDFASGSSMASAHVAGAAALLRAVDRRLDGAAVERLLANGGRGAASLIDACRALHRLAARSAADCAALRGP